jgi:hypothetical protein
MLNLRTFTSLMYGTHFAVLGISAQTNSSQLKDIVPRRDVLYVGGQYTNVAVRVFYLVLKYGTSASDSGDRTMQPISHPSP